MKLEFDTDAGIGRRATLGVVVLETDETLEHELARITGIDGVALYHSRIPMQREIRPETLARMEADLPAAAGLLPVAAGFDVIGYGCTSGASVIGSDRVAAAVNRVLPAARVTDPLAAIIAALDHLKARRIGFLTPYLPEVSARMRARLEAAGIVIGAFGSFEEGDDRVVARISETAIEVGAKRLAAGADIDAVVISCTNLRCLNVIPRIEAEAGIPVVSSNQALGWHMLRHAGIQDARPGMGWLLA